jgi:hypothetical protein
MGVGRDEQATQPSNASFTDTQVAANSIDVAQGPRPQQDPGSNVASIEEAGAFTVVFKLAIHAEQTSISS